MWERMDGFNQFRSEPENPPPPSSFVHRYINQRDCLFDRKTPLDSNRRSIVGTKEGI